MSFRAGERVCLAFVRWGSEPCPGISATLIPYRVSVGTLQDAKSTMRQQWGHHGALRGKVGN